MRDFTLSSYCSMLDAALPAGYRACAVVDWLDRRETSGEPALVLRHDVDRRPWNALAMAEAEAERSVRSTYYFRVVGEAWNETVIDRIARMGHEIGYHYEDFFTARYDADRAIRLFADNLARIRAIAPVATIAMHGSPLARHNNMKLWDHHRFEPHGVRDCILSCDWQAFTFFTDTGRTFGKTGANLRDTIGASTPDGVRSSADVAAFLAARRSPLVQLSTHPERWNESWMPWARQAAIDLAANSAKRVIAQAAVIRGS